MKRYFVKLAAFLLALALPFAVMLGLAVFSPEMGLGDAMTYSLHYKIDLLQDTPAPRIIFAGGSASENALICQRVADAAGQPAICIGVTAYLGLDIYLGLLDRYAIAGDTVVLMPETVLLRAEAVNYDLLWRALGSDPDAWAAVPPRLWPGLAMNLHTCLRAKEKAGWDLWRDGLALPDYSAASLPENLPPRFGPLGDIIALRPAPLLESGYNTEDPVAFSAEAPNPEILQRVRAFARRMERRGARVLFAYPPLDVLCVTSTPAQNAEYAAAVEAGLGLPVLVTLEESLMDAAYFYDSNNHLTTPGAEIYTDLLTARLLPLLA